MIYAGLRIDWNDVDCPALRLVPYATRYKSPLLTCFLDAFSQGGVGHLPTLVEQRGPAIDPRPGARGLAAILAWQERHSA
jgi:hypothetical protein